MECTCNKCGGPFDAVDSNDVTNQYCATCNDEELRRVKGKGALSPTS